MTTSRMTAQRQKHRSSSWGRALTAFTAALLLLSTAIVVRFALAEDQAVAQVNAYVRNLGGSNRPASTSIDLEAWLETNASKEDSDAWGRILNEVAGGYFDAQLKNLWTSPSDSLEDQYWLRRLDSNDPKKVEFAWQIEPNLVAEFIEFTKPLRQRIHQLSDEVSDEESVIYFPLLHHGAHTTLAEMQAMLQVAKLIYLENEDAIRRKDSEGVRQSLRTIDVLEAKLRYPVPGAVLIALQVRTYLASALHRALDAEMIEPDAWSHWLDRLRNRPDLRYDRVIDKPWFLLFQDIQQTAVVRLALLRYMHEKKRLPQRLDELPASWITSNDWTNDEGKEIGYVLAEDQASAFISTTRSTAQILSDFVSLPLRYDFELTQP